MNELKENTLGPWGIFHVYTHVMLMLTYIHDMLQVYVYQLLHTCIHVYPVAHNIIIHSIHDE